MNEFYLFPKSLRIADELDWVYTSSRKMAKSYGIPHKDIVTRITTLKEVTNKLNSEAGRRVFRYGLLTYQGQETNADDDFEILLNQEMFWILLMNLTQENPQARQDQIQLLDSWHLQLSEAFDDTLDSINRMKAQLTQS